MGVRLLADGAEVKVWHGKHTEHFEAVHYPLDGLQTKRYCWRSSIPRSMVGAISCLTMLG